MVFQCEANTNQFAIGDWNTAILWEGVYTSLTSQPVARPVARAVWMISARDSQLDSTQAPKVLDLEELADDLRAIAKARRGGAATSYAKFREELGL